MEKETAIMGLTFLTLVGGLGWGFWEHWRTKKDKETGVQSPVARHLGSPATPTDGQTPPSA